MTDRVDIQGRDVALEAYRISTPDGRAMVPEWMMTSSLRPNQRPSHQEAYEWIAANRPALIRAVAQLQSGKTPARPFECVRLVDDP